MSSLIFGWLASRSGTCPAATTKPSFASAATGALNGAMHHVNMCTLYGTDKIGALENVYAQHDPQKKANAKGGRFSLIGFGQMRRLLNSMPPIG
eukprot:6474383-Amphidinium_carterae.3